MITGGAGFIGSNLIRWLFHHVPGVAVVNVDLLTYAGDHENLADVRARHGAAGDGRYWFVQADVRELATMTAILRGEAKEHGPTARAIPAPDALLHLAADSHVDRSIAWPLAFGSTNVLGTLTLLEACRAAGAMAHDRFRFVQVSTDEVYGRLAASAAPWAETSPMEPNSPYAASKAAADSFVRSFVETFGLPGIITRSCNNYGPFQFPEKLIPLMTVRALARQPLPVYGDGLYRRSWVHVDDHASALWAVLTRGRIGEIYHVGDDADRTNLEVVHAVLRILNQPPSLVHHVADRLGHDRRYAMSARKLRDELGWQPTIQFEAGLTNTVRWYADHPGWWERKLAGDR